MRLCLILLFGGCVNSSPGGIQASDLSNNDTPSSFDQGFELDLEPELDQELDLDLGPGLDHPDLVHHQDLSADLLGDSNSQDLDLNPLDLSQDLDLNPLDLSQDLDLNPQDRLPRWDLCEPEICDGLDNDCDGFSDELLECCTPGESQQCGVQLGVCGLGVQRCEANFSWGSCPGLLSQGEEICDGLDNDCDGLTDEEVLNACGVCGPLPLEICDGADNDCDGEFDEGFELGEPCAEGEGSCRREGLTICALDGAGIICSATPGEPEEELCDGLDNDCDGLIDEELDLMEVSTAASCEEAEILVRLEEGQTERFEDQLYPAGDSDLFRVIALERQRPCVQDRDDPGHRLRIAVEGVEAQICTRWSYQGEDLCAQESICRDRRISLLIPPRCDRLDHADILIMLSFDDSESFQCQSYTLNISNEGL